MAILKIESRQEKLGRLALVAMGARHGLSAEFSFERPVYELSKRVFDIVLASIGLVVAIPLMMVAAAAIKSSSAGPVFYRHTRVGRYGRYFTCYKLRTMIDGAETHLEDAAFRERFSELYKLPDDPRVTSVGRLLRKTSLDELPQLWNVLRGEMSIVGPRPVIEEELTEKYVQHAQTVLSVTPGITGLSQISGRSELEYERRVALDMQYCIRRSFALDLWILWRTPVVLLLMRGAC
jgi:exopolysaccharide production protein ExoY